MNEVNNQTTPEVNNPNPYEGNKPPKKKGGCLKIGLIVVGVLFLLAIIGAIIGGGGDSDTEKATSTTPQTTETTIEKTEKETTEKIIETTTEKPVETTTEKETTVATTTTTTTTVETTIEQTLSTEEELEAYKLLCEEVKYEDVARNPNDYVGKNLKIVGEVNQAMPDGDEYMIYSVYEDYDYEQHTTFLDKRWIVLGEKLESNRILENDVVTFYGMFLGLNPLETVGAGTVEIPTIYLYAHEFVE